MGSIGSGPTVTPAATTSRSRPILRPRPSASRSAPMTALVNGRPLRGNALDAARCPWPLFAAVAYHTPEADMAGRGIDRLGMSGRRPVAAAVARRAEMRAPLQHLARNADIALARIVAGLQRSAPRVLRDTAGLGRVGRMACRIP